MKIAFVYAGGREQKWNDACAGRVPSDFFYGAVEISRNGHEVLCIDAPENPKGLLAAAYNRLLGWRTPVRTRGEHVVAVGAILRKLRGADAVVATSTSHANALAIWRKLGMAKPPIAGIHCGLVNFPLQGQRLGVTQRLLRPQQVVLFADSERAETVSRFRLRDEQVSVNPFGVDTDFWTPDESVQGEGFLAVGNDGRRDYATMIQASEGVSDTITIVTAREFPSPLPSNVRHIKGSWHRPALTDLELRDLYRKAVAVVIPLKDSLQPSGQSVALQAMACGKPIIITRTQGLWTGADFREFEHLLFAEPASPDSLRKPMELLANDRALAMRMGSAAREAVTRVGTMKAFAARLESLLDRVTRSGTPS